MGLKWSLFPNMYRNIFYNNETINNDIIISFCLFSASRHVRSLWGLTGSHLTLCLLLVARSAMTEKSLCSWKPTNWLSSPEVASWSTTTTGLITGCGPMPVMTNCGKSMRVWASNIMPGQPVATATESLSRIHHLHHHHHINRPKHLQSQTSLIRQCHQPQFQPHPQPSLNTCHRHHQHQPHPQPPIRRSHHRHHMQPQPYLFSATHQLHQSIRRPSHLYLHSHHPSSLHSLPRHIAIVLIFLSSCHLPEASRVRSASETFQCSFPNAYASRCSHGKQHNS